MINSRSFLVVCFVAASMMPAQARNPCGISPDDWCTSAKDSRCGRHLTATECRSDAACVGMRYAGESAIACHWDERGFADNCPTVGCLPR